MTENKIDNLTQKIPQDLILIGCFLALIIFCIWWKSVTLLLVIFIIIILIVIGGYSKSKEIGKYILVKKLDDWGVPKEITDPTFDNFTTASSTQKDPIPLEIKNITFSIPDDERKNIKVKFTSDSIQKINLAKKYLKFNEIDNAIQTLEESIKKDPNNWYSYLLLGSIYLNYKNDSDNALKYLISAMEIDKNHFNQFMNAGVAYIWKSENKLAIEALNKSIEIIERDQISRHLPRIKMEYGKCLMFIAEAFQNLDDKENSIKYLEMSIKKVDEIPNQDRNIAINYWLEEARKRLSKVKEKA